MCFYMEPQELRVPQSLLRQIWKPLTEADLKRAMVRHLMPSPLKMIKAMILNDALERATEACWARILMDARPREGDMEPRTVTKADFDSFREQIDKHPIRGPVLFENEDDRSEFEHWQRTMLLGLGVPKEYLHGDAVLSGSFSVASRAPVERFDRLLPVVCGVTGS